MQSGTMRAQVLVRNGAPASSFEMRDLPVPHPGPGQVRIRVAAFGINYADIMARQGLYRGCPPLPCVIGYDVEGFIDAVGPNVERFKPGDAVFGLTRFGGYAEYAVTSADAVSLLAADAPSGIGCALSTTCVTAYHSAVHSQTLMPGEKVLIHAAAGGLGLALIHIALWRGCTVIGVVGGQEKAEFLKQYRVHHIIDHHNTDYQQFIHDHLDGRVDVIFDNVGGASLKKGKKLLASGGRLVTLGAAALSGRKGKLNLIKLALGFGWFSPISFLGKSQSLIGVNMLKIADHRPDMIAASFQGVKELYEEGILKPHVDKIFPASDIAAAHTYVEGRHAKGKVVVTWP